MLKQDAITPLYVQLMEELETSIRNGVYKPGDKIMTEAEMAKEYGVSLITVRKAVGSLMEKGLVVRKQGKGTFVKKPKYSRNMKKLQSFSDMCRQMGMNPGARMVENHLVPVSAPIARRLGVDAGSSVIYISRLRLADGVPVQIEKSYFPLSYAFLLEAKFDDNSLFDYLRKSRGVWVASSEKSIEVCRVTKEEAALLNIQKGDLQLCVKSTAFDANEQVLYTGVQIINGDLFSLYVYESEQ
mgnify:FL=1